MEIYAEFGRRVEHAGNLAQDAVLLVAGVRDRLAGRSRHPSLDQVARTAKVGFGVSEHRRRLGVATGFDGERPLVDRRDGIDPFTKQPVYVAKHLRDRKLQRALLQFFKPENYFEVRKALEQAGRHDLIGDGCDCLIPSSPPRVALDERRH